MSSQGGRGYIAPWNLFARALIPFVRLHSHDLITSQRPFLLTASHQGLGFQHVHFGGGDGGTGA